MKTNPSKFRMAMDKFIMWWNVKKFVFLLVILGLMRYRMSHNNGVAGTGWLRIIDDPDIPPNDFYQPGRKFNIRVRHASATFLDDAMKVIRSCSIKFSEHHFKSPLDLEFNSGEFSVFWSAASFIKFAKSRKEKWGVDWIKYNRDYPDGSKGAQLSVRRHATSFYNLRYHSKTPFHYISTDGTKYYCKYKVRPDQDVMESGIDPNPSVIDTSNQRVLPHETRGKNFLKDEYRERVKRGPMKYRLQIQLRKATDQDDPEIFNNMRVWDENEFPWKDLAVFEVNKILDWKDSTMTTFSLKNMPKSLGIIPAKSMYDYNSLNYIRAKSEIARKARLFSYKIFGMVPPIPDNDQRNIKVWTKQGY